MASTNLGSNLGRGSETLIANQSMAAPTVGIAAVDQSLAAPIGIAAV